jgi:histidine triad (HIT) family protein
VKDMPTFDKDCLFCKIISGQIPSKKVFENEEVFAFLDIFPIASGHTVVVPKNHCMNLLDFPENEISPFFSALKQIAGMLKNKLGADGFNIIQNNFPAAGQVIPHYHYHIIPRREGDNAIHFKQKAAKEEDSVLDAILAKLK